MGTVYQYIDDAIDVCGIFIILKHFTLTIGPLVFLNIKQLILNIEYRVGRAMFRVNVHPRQHFRHISVNCRTVSQS